MLTISLYYGKTDQVAHVQTYKTWMTIAKADAVILCNAFPLTLSRPGMVQEVAQRDDLQFRAASREIYYSIHKLPTTKP